MSEEYNLILSKFNTLMKIDYNKCDAHEWQEGS